MPLRIAVDLVYFTGRRGGTESYARGLYPAMAAHKDLRFVGIGNRELAANPPQWFPGRIVGLPVDGRNRVTWAAAVAMAVAPQARMLGADVLHCPSNFGPAVPLLPTVVTVHDLLPLRHPEWVSGIRRRGVQALTKVTGRTAHQIITDSHASAGDITDLLGRRRSDVDVIQLGIDLPSTSPTRSTTQDHPYVLTGGNRMPHKNFDRLLQAWALIPRAERPRLVVTGSHGHDPLSDTVRRLDLCDDVQLLGWVSAEELAELYDNACAYVFPSLFEGFGLPILEAMARGCPVLSSDIPVLREAGGDAAMYVDALDPAAMASAVRGLVADRARCTALAAAGRSRAAAFSWQRTADATAEVFRELAARRRRIAVRCRR